MGARGAKMSAGAGANPPGLAVLLGFRTSTYLLFVPDKDRNALLWGFMLVFFILRKVCAGSCEMAAVKPHSAELTCLPGEHVDRGTTTRRSRRSSRASSWRSNGPWTHLGESNWRRRRGLTLKEFKKKKNSH